MSASPETERAISATPCRLRISLLVFLSVVAATIVYFLTFQGIGIGTDSLYYIGAAKKALAGHWREAIDPTGHFPPFYSWSVAVGAFVCGDVLVAARILNILSAVVTVYLFVLLALRGFSNQHAFLRRFIVLSFCAIALLMGDDFLRLFSLSLSEPLFVALVLTSVFTAIKSEEKSSSGLALISGAVMGLGILTRYAGAFFVPAIAGVIFVAGGKSRQKALANALLFFAAAVSLPLLVKMISPAAPPRPFAFHLPGAWHWSGWGYTFAVWILPYRLALASPFVGICISMLIAVTFAAFGWKSFLRTRINGPSTPENVLLLSVLSFFFYAVLLIVTVMFFDFSTPFDYRLLYPVHVLALLIFARFLSTKVDSFSRTGWNILLAVLALWLGGQTLRGVKTTSKIAHEGMALSSKSWRESTAAVYLRHLSATVSLTSNKPELLLFVFNRACEPVPRRTDQMSARANPLFLEEIRALGEKLRSKETLLVWIPDSSDRAYQAKLDEIKAVVPLRKLSQSGGSIELYEAE